MNLQSFFPKPFSLFLVTAVYGVSIALPFALLPFQARALIPPPATEVGDGGDLNRFDGVVSFFARKAFLYSAVTSSYHVSKLFAAPLIGSFSDCFGRKTVLILNLVCLAITLALTAQASTIYHLIACRFLTGAFGVSGVLLSALAVDFSQASSNHDTNSETQAQLITFVNSGWALAYIVSPPLFDLVHSHSAVYALSSAFALGSALLAFVLLPNSSSNNNKTKDNETKDNNNNNNTTTTNNNTNTFHGLTTALKDLISHPLCALIVFSDLALPTHDTSHLLASRFAGTPKLFALDFALGSVVRLVLPFLPFHFLKSDQNSSSKTSHIAFYSCITCALTIFFLPFCPTLYAFYFLIAIKGAAFSLLEPRKFQTINSLTKSNSRKFTGAFVGWQHFFRSVFVFPASLHGEMWRENVGEHAPFVVAGVVFVCLAVLMRVAEERQTRGDNKAIETKKHT